jgi:hypothetical protein
MLSSNTANMYIVRHIQVEEMEQNSDSRSYDYVLCIMEREKAERQESVSKKPIVM